MSLHHSLLHVLGREVQRLRGDALTPWLLLWLPVLGCVLILAMFAQRRVADLPVVLLDLDHSARSRELVAAIDATPAARIAFSRDSVSEAAQLIRRGKAYAVVLIPAHFERDLLRGEQPILQLIVNQQAVTAANSISRDVQAVALTFSATFSAGMRMREGAPRYAAAAATQALRVELHPLFNPGIDYAAYLGIALIAATLHCFVLIQCVLAVGRERRDRSLDAWRDAAGDSLSSASLGKLLPALVWWNTVGLAGLWASYASLGLPAPGSPVTLATGFILLVTSYTALGVCLAVWSPELRLAASLASLIAAPALAFSGISFPLDAMPLVARLVGSALPLTQFLHLQVEQVSEQAGYVVSLPRLGWLAGFTVAFGVVALPRLRWLLRHPQATSV